MDIRLMVVALLSAFVIATDAMDYLCGAPLRLNSSLRSGPLNAGQNTNPREHPWLVQLVYADQNLSCAGSLISDRHVLTARRCVDDIKPESVRVLYSTKTEYGGAMTVKDIRTPSDAKADLAVLELSLAVEISDTAVPICLTNQSDENTYPQFTGFHFGPRRDPGDAELARSMYQDVLYPKDGKECLKALGEDFHEDKQFCVGKRNEVFTEGIYTGAPVLVAASNGRYIQVGIALQTDAEHNYGSATRVSLYQKEIYDLTGCYLTGVGADSKPSGKEECDEKKSPRLVRIAGEMTFEEAQKACMERHGTVATPDGPENLGAFFGGLKPEEQGTYWVLLRDPLVGSPNAGNCNWMRNASAMHDGPCNSFGGKAMVVCATGGGEKCTGEGQLYFNGSCYWIEGSGTDYDAYYNATEGEAKCEQASPGAKLASIHSEAENYAARLVVGEKFPPTVHQCVRIGMTFNVGDDGSKHSKGKVYDGTPFDFGYQECNESPGSYPYCPENPDCAQWPATSIVMVSEYYEGRQCWDDRYDDWKCAALCKKKVE